MKLENQVCSLEQAKRLKELGVEQTSLFRFIETNEIRYKFDLSGLTKGLIDKMHSAFTVAELGVMLGINTSISIGTHKYHCRWWRGNIGDMVLRDNNDKPTIHFSKSATTMAESMAEMLIHLLENNLITSEEVNKRLLK